jgi:hypothetical protein
METVKHTPRLTLIGGRGAYILMDGDRDICLGSNKERLRGIQYFLEARPEYRAAPELLNALRVVEQWHKDGINPTAKELCTIDDVLNVVRAAIAKATGA